PRRADRGRQAQGPQGHPVHDRRPEVVLGGLAAQRAAGPDRPGGHGEAELDGLRGVLGGAKVANLGNDARGDLTLTVRPPDGGGDYLLTLVGAVAGTRTVYVSVNGGPAQPVVVTDSSFTSPLVAHTIQVRLHGRANTVRLFNATGYAPDIDKIQLSPLHCEE